MNHVPLVTSKSNLEKKAVGERGKEKIVADMTTRVQGAITGEKSLEITGLHLIRLNLIRCNEMSRIVLLF